MADNSDRVVELYKALRLASRDAFLFQQALAELSDEELSVLENVCASYQEKNRASRLPLIGYRHREDLERGVGKRLRRLFTKKPR